MLNLAKYSLLFLLVIQFFLATSATLVADDPPEVGRIAQTAIGAQNAGDYELAATQWEKLIADHPDSSQIGVAFYQAGICYVQTTNYARAADRLQQAIAKLDKDRTVSIAQAYLFLGFSQAKLGRELIEESPEESQRWLTTATQNFVTLLKKYPKFDDADQAWFFQADAYEALGRVDDAANSYSKMLGFEKAEFKLDGLFALAFIRGQQGKYDVAYDLYSQFETEGTQHPSYNEVRFRAGEALMELANAADNLGDKKRFTNLLADASQKFESVYGSRDADWADQARFQQAVCAQRLGQYAESARLFESVVQISNSKLVDRARVYAGRDFLRASDGNAAAQTLEKAVAVPSPYAPEAAHWLSQFYLRANQNDKAYTLATEWIDKTEDLAVKVPLLLDQADAAYASSHRRKEARALYLNITDKFADHALAPTALYNAAYAAMESGNFDDATSAAKRFRTQYGQSDYLPDVLEVEADSFLLAGNAKSAEASFNDLVNQFAGHPKSSGWKLRSGLAKYMQKKYEETITSLGPLVATLKQAEKQAETLHWIGSSHYQLGNSSMAVDALRESFATSDSWRRADETLLTLSRALFQDKKQADAKKTTQQLISTFPNSPLIGEANYRLGEFEYDADNYAAALQKYAAVIEYSEDSQFAPYALYGIGWSQLQLNQFKIATESFSKLINTFPKHALATQVLIGRASAWRQSGNTGKAIADIQTFLISEPVDSKKEEAFYELGLAQIAENSWPDVVATFNELLLQAPNSDLADRYNYELAWAYKSNKNSDLALKHFKTIADRLPNSPLAAESNFHVAQDAYNRKEYDRAVGSFSACIEKCSDPKIKEKAIYKLAWTYYKKKNFDNALIAFRKQISEFPQGSSLYADALFMVSESLYEGDHFKEALQEYRVAKPVMETSTTVSTNFKILTMLHGAQSANQAKEYDTALEFAQSLLEMDVDKFINQEAQMEIGDAYRGLNDTSKAISAYEQAAMHPGKTGARSMCMAGEILFDQKKFDDAINKFKLVLYGYGGNQSKDVVKPWQAFAAYEAARCNFVQVSSVTDNPALRKTLITEARKHFKFLVDNFPTDKLAPNAKRQLKELETVQ